MSFVEEICMHELGTFAIEEDTSFEMLHHIKWHMALAITFLCEGAQKDDELQY